MILPALLSALAAAAAGAADPEPAALPPPAGLTAATTPGALPPGEPGSDYTPVVVPNGSTLSWHERDGVKIFHLTAEPLRHDFAPGLTATVWGYNGQCPGPVLELVEGDHIRVYLTNHLPEKTTLHWHGVLVPNGQDGVAGVTQAGVEPGATAIYEFTVHQHGTFMYHPHYDEMTQMGMGMMGMVVIHPRRGAATTPPAALPPVDDRDFAIMLSEWSIPPGTSRPDPNEMTDFNVLTMNAKAFPGTAPLVARLGERVRIRLGNLGAMEHHPIHLHGYEFTVVAEDGNDVPPTARTLASTVLVPVGTTRDIDFVADAPGDWALHCHMTHHAMNQMGHGHANLLGADLDGFDQTMRRLLPEGFMAMGSQGMGEMATMGMPVPANAIPMVGADGPHGYIDMGGMFTILKVRSGLTSYADPGWYAQPPGTAVRTATADDLSRDGIAPDPGSAPAVPASPAEAPAPGVPPPGAPAP